MWKKMSGFVSLFLCTRIHSFVGLNGCSVLVCMWPCAIADIQHIDISSTWKRNSWQICHIMCCSVTRTARVWCDQWDKLWFSTLYSQNVGFWPKRTQKNTYKHWKREREVEPHANDVDQWQKLWVFNRRDIRLSFSRKLCVVLRWDLFTFVFKLSLDVQLLIQDELKWVCFWGCECGGYTVNSKTGR